MKKLLILASLLIGFSSTLIAQHDTNIISNSLLDDEHPERAKRVIDKAVDDNDINSIIVALHNKDYSVQTYCLDRLSNLNTASQAKVLAHVLVDDKFLQYGDELPSGGGKRMSLQTKLQEKIRLLAYKLLSQQPPSNTGLMPRAEAVSLATKLLAAGQK